MGGKYRRIRNHLYLCLALVAALSIAGCAVIENYTAKLGNLQDRPEKHLVRARQLAARGDFAGSLEENRLAFALAGDQAPADEALFNMGVLYARPANDTWDPVKPMASFRRLIKDFPESPWIAQATIWLGVLGEAERLKRTSLEAQQEIERLKQASAEAFQEVGRLKRVSGEAFQENDRLKRASAEIATENQRLKRIVEQSSLVDMEIEQKKRSQVR